jgi:acylphosphatase
VRVTGRVQGVGFRYAVVARARSLDVGGWVSNLGDGSVEAVFEGDDEAVASLVAWCEHGPRGAEVRHVDVSWREPQGDSRTFGVR